MALADYQNLVASLVDDPSGITTDEDCDQAIELAALQYSKDKPRVQKFDVTGTGSLFVDLPPEFEDEFSKVLDVELLEGDRPIELDNQDWKTYLGLTAWQLRFNSSIAAGEDVRVKITTKHKLDVNEDTIPETDRLAVAHWAASVLLDQLANAVSGDRQSTIIGDSVDHGSKASNYRTAAKKSRDLFYELLGIKRGRIKPAGVVIDWDSKNSRGGDHLIHGRRHR